MKRIFLVVIGIIGLLCITFGIIDYKRVRSGDRPLFMIRISDDSEYFQHYVGLGYRLVREVNVSYREPLYLDDEIRFGLWTFTWKLTNYSCIDYVYTIKTNETNKCNKTTQLYYSEDSRNIYTYCLDSISTSNGNDFKDYLKNNNIKLDTFIEGLIFVEEDINGQYKIYKDTGKTQNIDSGFTNNGLTILKCNTKEGNKDVYIGPKWMNYEKGFCEKI